MSRHRPDLRTVTIDGKQFEVDPRVAEALKAEREAASKAASSMPRLRGATAPATSKAALDAAVGKARAEERQRISTVFAAEHSRGRERLCATLLASRDGWAATQIVNNLARCSTDAELERKASAAEHASADGVWDRANAKVTTRSTPAPRAKGASIADDPHARAYGHAAGGVA